MTAFAKVHVPTESGASPSQPRKKRRGRRPLYTKAARRGRGSRRKGAEAEIEVRDLAREAGFVRAERRAPMQSGNGDAEHADVANVGRLWVEVKRRGKGSMYALAVDACRERAGFIPTLAYREDRGPWLAVVPLRELLKLEAAALRLVSAGGGSWDAVEAADREDADALRTPKEPDAPA